MTVSNMLTRSSECKKMISLNAFDAFIYQAILSSVEDFRGTYGRRTDENNKLSTEPYHLGKKPIC